ncbi:hypothetical protein MCELANE86_00858 [Candidatus Nanopelagicaceae bacterium]|jgi:hypothetical protein
MAQVVERTVWRTHYGKEVQVREMMNEFKALVLKLGVSRVEIQSGMAGKDVGCLIMNQYFKNAEDNGRLNDAFANDADIQAFMKKQSTMPQVADFISHDLYAVEE